MTLERRRDVNISLIISSAPVNTSPLSPTAAAQKLTVEKRECLDQCFSAGNLAPRGHWAEAGDVFGCRGRERRRCCEWRPEVLLSILQVPGTAPHKGRPGLQEEDSVQISSVQPLSRV